MADCVSDLKRMGSSRGSADQIKSSGAVSFSMSLVGQTQTSGRIPARSVLPPTTDMRRPRQHFRLVPQEDVLKFRGAYTVCLWTTLALSFSFSLFAVVVLRLIGDVRPTKTQIAGGRLV
jgi:hypothetical protein